MTEHDIVSISIRIPVSQELMDNKEALKSFTTSAFKDECKVLDISLVGDVAVSDSMQTIDGMQNCVIATGRVVFNDSNETAIQRELWVTGRNEGNGCWHILGVFDQEPLAVLAATDEKDFVGPIKLNQRLPDDAIDWPNAYYPVKD